MSPGADSGLSPTLLAANSNADYEKLCALDVLGLVDSESGDQSAVYDEFKEGVVERAPVEVTGREFFLPHRAVVRGNQC